MTSIFGSAYRTPSKSSHNITTCIPPISIDISKISDKVLSRFYDLDVQHFSHNILNFISKRNDNNEIRIIAFEIIQSFNHNSINNELDINKYNKYEIYNKHSLVDIEKEVKLSCIRTNNNIDNLIKDFQNWYIKHIEKNIRVSNILFNCIDEESFKGYVLVCISM